MKRVLLCAAVLATGLITPPAIAADPDPSFLVVHGGAYNVGRPDEVAGEFGLQYRSSYEMWIFKPHAGALIQTDGLKYGYAGVLVDLYFGKRFVMTASTSVGLYQRGDADTLGDKPLVFRSGIEGSYRFDNRSRLGLGVYHMSNAQLMEKKNPGEESVIINYAIPLGRSAGK